MSVMTSIVSACRGDSQAHRIVPPTGFTARLTVFSAATMSFLTVFALTLSLASGRLGQRWGDELAQTATLRISAPGDQSVAQTKAALQVLDSTPGVASARALSAKEQRVLLAPWFGPDLPVDSLPIPQLIEIKETVDGFDAAGLRLRLQAEVPGAVLDDHTRWRAPLERAAERLKVLGWVSILLIGTTTAAIITLAANAALAANAQVIAVLRLIGAQDSYIALAFVRRFTLRALLGAGLGTTLGIFAVMVLPAAQEEGGFLTGLGFEGINWILPFLIPPLAALVAYTATGAAARKTLSELA